MNAIQLVMEQHREIDALARALLVVAPADRAHVLRLLGDRIEAHLEIEEKILYPTVRTHRDKNAVDAYVHDHHELRMQMLRLMHPGLVDHPDFLEEAALAATMIREHAHEEEEAHMLPLLAASLSEPELQALGDEMLALYQELRDGQPFRTIVAEAREHAFQRLD